MDKLAYRKCETILDEVEPSAVSKEQKTVNKRKSYKTCLQNQTKKSFFIVINFYVTFYFSKIFINKETPVSLFRVPYFMVSTDRWLCTLEIKIGDEIFFANRFSLFIFRFSTKNFILFDKNFKQTKNVYVSTFVPYVLSTWNGKMYEIISQVITVVEIKKIIFRHGHWTGIDAIFETRRLSFSSF